MKGFKINNMAGAAYYTSPIMDKEKAVHHFFSSRIGGRSTGPYESLNLGVYTEDAQENTGENMSRIFTAAGMNHNNAVYLKQVHGDTLYIVTNDNLNQTRGLEGDGLITREIGIPIGIFTADCVPILLFDRNRKIAAALHGGWKGTALGIVKKAVELMCLQMGASPKDIIAAIGPCIGKCCFEVGREVAEKFESSIEREKKLYVDLALENASQLKSCGVIEENISISGMCTFCSQKMLFSYRRDRGLTGRMGSFIEII